MDSEVKQLHLRAESLVAKFKQGGGASYINKAIVLQREAVELCPPGHPKRSSSLTRLASRLSNRYDQLGATRDLEEAVVLNREALDICPQGHPDRSMSLINLAKRLATRYGQLGAMQDLNEAIALNREALELCPQGHPSRSNSLNNLANRLSTRYKQLGAIQDLDEGIVLAREALNLFPQGHPDRSSSLNNLAICLSTRYKQLGAVHDLAEAIVLDREALDLRPQRYPKRLISLNNLAIRLSTRYQQLGAMEDLDEAIVLLREALDLCPQGHPKRTGTLNNLARCLSARYKHLRVMEDLDEAIVLGREAFNLRPQGHPDRSEALDNLAGYLCDRFTRSGRLQDKEELFSLYAQLACVPQIAFSSDLSAARAWIRVAEDFQHPTTLLAYETSLRLLIQHLAALPSLPQHLVILKNLTSSLAVDAFSRCLRDRAPARAVEFLEQGRGVFWSQLTRLHSPLDDVMVSSPAGKTLADEFTRLALLIRNALNSPGVDQHERLCRLNFELQIVVINIRKLPGLSRFLLPSLFPDLQRAAGGGPVIIVNASKYSCDALIVFFDRDPVHIPLQITQKDVQDLSKELHTLTAHAKRADVTKELAFFLRKLWDQIVSPIVDCLKATHPAQSRIWWCPTAEFSALPFHAAGPHRKGQKNLPHLYISSYTPTLTALIRARRPNPSNSTIEHKRFVAIGQAKAAGESQLLSVGAELDTVQRITGCDFKNPEFAYLSACHTTVGYEESPDEVIHLASAMQFAGFRSVIGTMWAVDDGETKKITSTFYKHMVDESGRLDHTRAAFAMNKTMKSVNIPFDQRVLYIHLGA